MKRRPVRRSSSPQKAPRSLTPYLIAALLALAAAVVAQPFVLQPEPPVYVCMPQMNVLVCQPMDGGK